jgi:hypothetical protein
MIFFALIVRTLINKEDRNVPTSCGLGNSHADQAGGNPGHHQEQPVPGAAGTWQVFAVPFGSNPDQLGTALAVRSKPERGASTASST